MSQFRNPEISHLEGELAFRHAQRLAMDADKTKHDPKTGQFASSGGVAQSHGWKENAASGQHEHPDHPGHGLIINKSNNVWRHYAPVPKSAKHPKGITQAAAAMTPGSLHKHLQVFHQSGGEVALDPVSHGGKPHLIGKDQALDEHLGWTKMVQHLEGEGKLKESAERIAGAINAKKNG